MRRRLSVWAAAVAFLVACLVTPAFASPFAPQDEWRAPARAARKKNPVPAHARSIAAGRAVYVANCLACHGVTGKGNGPAAAALDPKPNDLADPKVWEQSDGALFWKIRQGRPPMPGYKKLLTEEERWNVLNYLHTFAPKTVEVSPPEFGVPEIYRQALSKLVKPYLKTHVAIVEEDLASAQAHARKLGAALENLKQLKTDRLTKQLRQRWHDDINAISRTLQTLLSGRDFESLPESFAGLSAALAEAVRHFGHAERESLRLFAARTEYGGKPATWLQAELKPMNPYVKADDRGRVTLNKMLGSHQPRDPQRDPKGGST